MSSIRQRGHRASLPSLAEAMRALRASRSQEQMARICGLSFRTYTRIEQGHGVKFSTLRSVLDRCAPLPQARAYVLLAWCKHQLGEKDFSLAASQLV